MAETKEDKTNFDISNLSLKELIEVYEAIEAFLNFLDESKVEKGETKDE